MRETRQPCLCFPENVLSEPMCKRTPPSRSAFLVQLPSRGRSFGGVPPAKTMAPLAWHTLKIPRDPCLCKKRISTRPDRRECCLHLWVFIDLYSAYCTRSMSNIPLARSAICVCFVFELAACSPLRWRTLARLLVENAAEPASRDMTGYQHRRPPMPQRRKTADRMVLIWRGRGVGREREKERKKGNEEEEGGREGGSQGARKGGRRCVQEEGNIR